MFAMDEKDMNEYDWNVPNSKLLISGKLKAKNLYHYLQFISSTSFLAFKLLYKQRNSSIASWNGCCKRKNIRLANCRFNEKPLVQLLVGCNQKLQSFASYSIQVLFLLKSLLFKASFLPTLSPLFFEPAFFETATKKLQRSLPMK